MAIPGIDADELERLLTEVSGRPVRLEGTFALGESTRATPWRVDVRARAEHRSYLVRFGESVSRNEVAALRAMTDHAIPTPRVLYWDETGDVLGTPVFVSELIDGIPLLPAMVAGDRWADDLYVETACALQAIGIDELPSGTADALGPSESIRDMIDAAAARFPERQPLHDKAYQRLIETQPEVPDVTFSNGDLWPENLLVKERRLVGVIDWQHAGWSDPIFEFLLPFFLVPELRNRGMEERYCERKGYDPALLGWYRGVEFFDSLSIVLKTGEPYELHTAASLAADLENWLRTG